jgi:hypothetical protein
LFSERIIGFKSLMAVVGPSRGAARHDPSLIDRRAAQTCVARPHWRQNRRL